MENSLIMIPSLEPDHKLLALVEKIRLHNQHLPILVVDDGSGVAYQPVFSALAQQFGCQVLTHPKNLGKGAAIKTALTEVLTNQPAVEFMVTIDSDGQHEYTDMMACLTKAQAHPDSIILGTRSFGKEVPLRSKFGNILTRNILRLATGLAIEDSQTGLRVFPRKFMRDLLTISGERFEYETRMLIEAQKRGWPILSQPIATIYIEENASSHFRVLADSVAIYSVFLKYLFSSVVSFFVDVIAYALLIHFLSVIDLSSIVIASLGARLISAIVNYYINRELVFGQRTKNSMLQYFLLVIVQILLSSFLVYLIYLILPIGDSVLLKIGVDCLLFFFSYHVQKNVIFKE